MIRSFVPTIAARAGRALGPFVLPTVVLLALVGGWYLIPDYSRGASSVDCPEMTEASSQGGLAEGVAPVPLILEQAEGVILNLGRDRRVQSRAVFLQVAKQALPQGARRFASLPRGASLSVSRRALEREELDGNIGSDRYVAVAEVTDRKELGLTICVDPTRSDADPGTYVGSVRISSRFIQPVTVPVTVTLQQPGYRWIVPLFGVITLLAGSFTVWAAGKKAQQGASSTPGVESVWKDLRQLPAWMLDNYVGVVAGAIAAISVFVAKYWRNPAWGARAPEDWLALLGSVFTAYTASLTAATALVPPRRRSQWTSSAEESTVAPSTPGPAGPDASVTGGDLRRGVGTEGDVDG